MSSYNLMKITGRDALRKDRQSELDALAAGTWPRDLNDMMRWCPPVGGKYSEKQWAEKMCKADIDYLDGVAKRLTANDPDLEGWER